MFQSNTKRSTSVVNAQAIQQMKVKFKLMRLNKLSSRNLLQVQNTSNTWIKSTEIGSTLKGGISAEQEVKEVEEQTIHTPGPGAYFNTENASSFRKVNKPPQYQFFGSSEERFQEANNLENLIKKRLGPGVYYNNDDSFHSARSDGNSRTVRGPNGKKQTFKTVAFNSEQNRFQQRISDMPGPGQYNEDSFQKINEPKSHNKAQNTFGSISKRFLETDLRKDASPGPGEYRPEKSLKSLANMKNEIMPQSAAFKSKVSDRQISNPILQHSPPVGTYNIEVRRASSNTRNIVLVQGKSVITMRPTIKEQIGFSSDVERFSGTLSKERVSPIRGPGYYDTPSVFDIQKQKGSSKLFSESHRFEHGSYMSSRKVQQLPGPGQYRGTDDNSLVAQHRSFNLMYN